ncbi:prepilin peptidase [Candidatus Poribacteria bacterium]|nr:prepilin peptidase [Candidatus Poribacteria bacterium]MBT5534259.1 prepilin peptidase [Candidatus Poribacteria bacterium]MBT5713568.1 prepilin peptidase [Candidatus Poribacteria bacterium]MBT7806585.1 prepilin peptidase [Candidatus Poribacteria bacterium]
MRLAPEVAAPAALVGLALGSFLNVIIHRVPIGETALTPRRSYCPHCRAPIRARDNVPLLSYVLLRGRCRDCDGAISVVYPAVEAATGALCVVAVSRFGVTLAALHAAVFGCFLLALAVTDVRTLRLPDRLTGVGVGAGLALAAAAGVLAGTPRPVAAAAVGAIVGVTVLGVVRAAGSAAMRREAMGLGDVKFLGMIGVYLADWRLVLLTVVLSAVVGSVMGLALRFAPARRVEIPYGPFLAVAAGISLVYGDALIDAYVRVILRG